MNVQAEGVAARFAVEGRLVSLEPQAGGHINDSWMAVWDGPGGRRRFLLQHINRFVFRKPEQVMENMERLTRHVGVSPRSGVGSRARAAGAADRPDARRRHPPPGARRRGVEASRLDRGHPVDGASPEPGRGSGGGRGLRALPAPDRRAPRPSAARDDPRLPRHPAAPRRPRARGGRRHCRAGRRGRTRDRGHHGPPRPRSRPRRSGGRGRAVPAPHPQRREDRQRALRHRDRRAAVRGGPGHGDARARPARLRRHGAIDGQRRGRGRARRLTGSRRASRSSRPWPGASPRPRGRASPPSSGHCCPPVPWSSPSSRRRAS